MDTNIKETTLQELVDNCIKAKSVIEEMEAQLQVLRDELGDRLTAMKLTGTVVGDYYVSRMKRVSFPDVTLKEAEEYGAVKKSIDSEKLKALYQKGIAIKVKVTEFVNIRPKKDNAKT